jgi:hypothetical protein
MRFPVSRFPVPFPIVIAAGALLALSACSRTDDKAGAPVAAGSVDPAVAQQEAAPAAGGPTTLKPGRWKTLTQTPSGPDEQIQCIGEGFDPGAEAAQKASPCGKPNVTRTADGFQLDLACERNHIQYALAGTVRGDFVTTATTDLDLTLSAYGRKQRLHLRAVSTYLGPCDPRAKGAD